MSSKTRAIMSTHACLDCGSIAGGRRRCGNLVIGDELDETSRQALAPNEVCHFGSGLGYCWYKCSTVLFPLLSALAWQGRFCSHNNATVQVSRRKPSSTPQLPSSPPHTVITGSRIVAKGHSYFDWIRDTSCRGDTFVPWEE